MENIKIINKIKNNKNKINQVIHKVNQKMKINNNNI